jgi:hypothetical protein
MLVATDPKKYKVSSKRRKNIDEYSQHIKSLAKKVNRKQLSDFLKKKQPSPKRKPLSPKPKKNSPPTLKRTLSGDSLPGIRLKRTLSGDSLPGIKSKPSHYLKIYNQNNKVMNMFKGK